MLIEVFSLAVGKKAVIYEQDTLNLPTHKFIADVSNRWGSTFEMVSRIIEQEEAICAVLADDRKCWKTKMNLPHLRIW